MNTETNTRIQLSSIKPDIRFTNDTTMSFFSLTVFALKNIVAFHSKYIIYVNMYLIYCPGVGSKAGWLGAAVTPEQGSPEVEQWA